MPAGGPEPPPQTRKLREGGVHGAGRGLQREPACVCCCCCRLEGGLRVAAAPGATVWPPRKTFMKQTARASLAEWLWPVGQSHTVPCPEPDREPLARHKTADVPGLHALPCVSPGKAVMPETDPAHGILRPGATERPNVESGDADAAPTPGGGRGVRPQHLRPGGRLGGPGSTPPSPPLAKGRHATPARPIRFPLGPRH